MAKLIAAMAQMSSIVRRAYAQPAYINVMTRAVAYQPLNSAMALPIVATKVTRKYVQQTRVRQVVFNAPIHTSNNAYLIHEYAMAYVIVLMAQMRLHVSTLHVQRINFNVVQQDTALRPHTIVMKTLIVQIEVMSRRLIVVNAHVHLVGPNVMD